MSDLESPGSDDLQPPASVHSGQDSEFEETFRNYVLVRLRGAVTGKYYGEKEFCLDDSSHDPSLGGILAWAKTLSDVPDVEVLIESRPGGNTILCSKQPYRKIGTFITDLPCTPRVENMGREDSSVCCVILDV